MNRALSKILLICFLAIISLPALVWSADIDDLKSKIDERNQQLEAIQKEIEQYEKQLQEVGAEKSTLQSAIKALDLTRNKLLADIKKIQNQINSETLNIQRLSVEIEEKEKKITNNNKAISEALRRVNETDNFSMIEGVLSKRNLSDFWETVENLTSFQVGIEEDLMRLKEVKLSLSQDKEEVEERKSTLLSQKIQLNGKAKVVEFNKSEKNELLSVTKSKEENYKILLEEKMRLKEQFEKELFDFESQLQFELDPRKLPSVGKGILGWPVDHIRITQKFGKTVDSKKLYASGTHNGVDFGVSTGSNVRATLSGIVQSFGNTDQYLGCESYGKWILIKHNNGLSTLYAHLSFINVSSGQQVGTGEIIGFSGNTGYSTGPHLHLTLFASQGVQLTKLGDIPGRPITKCSQATIPIAPSSAYLDPLDYL